MNPSPILMSADEDPPADDSRLVLDELGLEHTPELRLAVLWAVARGEFHVVEVRVG